MEFFFDLLDFEHQRHGLVERLLLFGKLVIIFAVEVAGLGALYEILVHRPQSGTSRLLQRSL